MKLMDIPISPLATVPLEFEYYLERVESGDSVNRKESTRARGATVRYDVLIVYTGTWIIFLLVGYSLLRPNRYIKDASDYALSPIPLTLNTKATNHKKTP